MSFDIPNMLPILLKATGVLLKLFSLTLLFSVPLALIIALGRMSRYKLLSYPVRFFLLIMRGTPLILQLAVVYFLPGYISQMDWFVARGISFSWNDRFNAAVVAFVINYAAYFAEIYRGGIESIPPGQYEAGKVLGMTRAQVFTRVVLPQVVKRILPACGNEVMTLVKDTALAQTIAVTELMRQAASIASREFSIAPYLVAGLIYLVINTVVEQVFHLTEKRLNYYH